MLHSLFIKNFVLIDELNIQFEDGFSVMTGETGAGKSIILGALALVLGQRVDTKNIQRNSDKCVVEAVFDISAYRLESFFTANDLEYDDRQCILRRELLSSGKSRAFVNDTPASLSVIKALGDYLIDIHSQHQNLLLADTQFQLNVVDVMANTADLLKVYREGYHSWLSLGAQIAALEEKAQKASREEDYIRFQHDELQAAKLVEGEQTQLEQEQDTLLHTEEIKASLYKLTALLDGEEQSAIRQLKEALSAMESLQSCFPKATGYAERLRTAFIDLKDLAAEANTLKEDVELDPERLEWVNHRLDTLYSLQQKHRVNSSEELIACRDRFAAQLKAIDSYDDEIAALRNKQAEWLLILEQQALEISELRKKSAQNIEQQLVQRMKLLSVPNIRFKIDFIRSTQIGENGLDEICFFFSANKNEPLKPVAQTASGGEISRLMLCIKAMIAGNTALPTIIFDEIDAGTSGEIADKMAEIMQDLGRNMQVITITHLPQIAAKGKAHYLVYKEDTTDRTITNIRRLAVSERVNEVARLLSGSSLTEASIANAKELLKV